MLDKNLLKMDIGLGLRTAKYGDTNQPILNQKQYEACYTIVSEIIDSEHRVFAPINNAVNAHNSVVMANVITAMIGKYGEDTQIDVAIEEMSELTKELVKYKRTKVYAREKLNNNRQAVIEEIADVLFMVEYLKQIFNVDSNELASIIMQKVNRTNERYLR